jgi:hypothetical protein
VFERCGHAVKTSDPFGQIDTARASARNQACRAATRWAYKAPDDKKSSVLMHWTTFNAILKRKGGPHYSRGREKREYNLPETM